MRKKQTKKRDFSIIGWGVWLSQEQASHIQISLCQDKDNFSPAYRCHKRAGSSIACKHDPSSTGAPLHSKMSYFPWSRMQSKLQMVEPSPKPLSFSTICKCMWGCTWTPSLHWAAQSCVTFSWNCFSTEGNSIPIRSMDISYSLIWDRKLWGAFPEWRNAKEYLFI